MDIFQKQNLPAVQTVPFLTPASVWQLPTDLGAKVTHSTQKNSPCDPPLPSSLCFCSLKSLSAPVQQGPRLVQGLVIIETAALLLSTRLRSLFQQPVVLTSSDGLLQKTRQAPLGHDSSCSRPGRQHYRGRGAPPKHQKKGTKSHFLIVGAVKISTQEDTAFILQTLIKILRAALVIMGLRLDVGSSDK